MEGRRHYKGMGRWVGGVSCQTGGGRVGIPALLPTTMSVLPAR